MVVWPSAKPDPKNLLTIEVNGDPNIKIDAILPKYPNTFDAVFISSVNMNEYKNAPTVMADTNKI
jgi:hypothetical protein